MDISLRAALPADDEFCFQVHKASLGPVVAEVWGWDDTEQRGYHAGAFQPSEWQIIVVDGVDAGVLVVERRADEIYLGRIELSPAHQGQGIGTRLIADLFAEAGDRDQPLVLEVIDANRRAHDLYLRLGFVETGRNGVKIHMARQSEC